MAKLKHFSGTPVSEGVRLEFGNYTVFAVRNTQKDISVRMRREPRKALRAAMEIPFLRGVIRFIRNITRFFDGIAESHELQPQRAARGSRFANAIAKGIHVSPQSFLTVISAICIPILAFLCLYAAPKGIEGLLISNPSFTYIAIRWIVCAVRILGILLFIWLCAHLRVSERLLIYRGALNKAGNCYACTGDVTLESAAEYPRCAKVSEPAFMLSTLIVSIVLFTLLSPAGILMNILMRVSILLGVAAVLHEPIALLENAEITPFVSVMRGPMDLIELAFTKKPGQQALEVAVCAFQAVMGDIQEIPETEESAE